MNQLNRSLLLRTVPEDGGSRPLRNADRPLTKLHGIMNLHTTISIPFLYITFHSDQLPRSFCCLHLQCAWSHLWIRTVPVDKEGSDPLALCNAINRILTSGCCSIKLQLLLIGSQFVKERSENRLRGNRKWGLASSLVRHSTLLGHTLMQQWHRLPLLTKFLLLVFPNVSNVNKYFH